MSEQERAIWLEKRRSYVGASDIPCIMGRGFKSPYALWAEKVGLVAPEESDSEQLWLGRHLEIAILNALESPRYLEMAVTPNFAQKPFLFPKALNMPWAAATPDGYFVKFSGQRVPVEAKNSGSYKESEWADGPPRAYVMQSLWQQLAMDAPYGIIAALIGGQKIVWAKIERKDHEPLIAEMIEKAKIFWQHVESKTPPPLDGHDTTHDAIKTAYPSEIKGKIAHLSQDLIGVDSILCGLKKQRSEIDAAIKIAEAQIKAAIGDAEEGWLPDGARYSLRTQHRDEHVIKASSFRVLRRHESKEKESKNG